MIRGDGGSVLRHEVRVSPIALRPAAVPGQRPRQRALVQRHAGNHGHMVLVASREQFVLRILVEDVVDHLDRVDQSALDRLPPVPWLPAVQAQADGVNQALRLSHRFESPLPACGRNPTHATANRQTCAKSGTRIGTTGSDSRSLRRIPALTGVITTPPCSAEPVQRNSLRQLVQGEVAAQMVGDPLDLQHLPSRGRCGERCPTRRPSSRRSTVIAR